MTPLAATEAERLKFEKWARTDDGNCNELDLRKWSNPQAKGGETYRLNLVERDWIVWQAARALQQTAEPNFWAVLADHGDDFTGDKELADYWDRKGRTVVALYRAAPDRAPSTEPVLARQIGTWRKEVERLQDLIATAEGAPSTDSAADDKKRLDWLAAQCTGASDSERYLPFKIYWGKKGATKGIRHVIDKAIAASLPQTKEE